jgi:hypothetical protein
MLRDEGSTPRLAWRLRQAGISSRSCPAIVRTKFVLACTRDAGRACWSLLHPWIVRRVGVHGRATVIAGFGAQFVVPGFVAIDPA